MASKRVELTEEARVQALAKDLVARLAMLMKTVRIHSVQNAALQYSVKIFVQAANDLYSHLGDFNLRGDADSIFVNDMRIRPEPILFDNITALMSELADRRAGGLRVHGALGPMEVRTILQVLLDFPALTAAEGVDKLNSELRARGVSQFTFEQRMSLVTEMGLTTAGEAKARRAVRVFAELVVSMDSYFEVGDDTVPDALRQRLLHAVQAAVDLMHEDPYWLVATATWRQEDNARSVGSVCTSLLALALAQRLDFGRKALLNLGLSALYAEAGWRRMGVDGRMQASSGGKAERLGRQQHPLESVKEVLQAPALTRGQRDRLMVAYESRIGHDGSGYPRPVRGKPKHIFSSIVTIARSYVELTSDTAESAALPPPRALEAMHDRIGYYEPRLLSIFAHVMGPYPLGTVVKLSTGEVAVVVAPPSDRRFRLKPKVRIVRNSAGKPVAPTPFDLGARNTSDGSFLTVVVDVLAPDSLPGAMTPAQVVLIPDDDASPRSIEFSLA